MTVPVATYPCILGFTGTRVGMTDAQRQRVRALLYELRPTALHHGMCVGADADMHQLMRDYDPLIHIKGWPGVSAGANPDDDHALRAKVEVDSMHEPLTHFARNRCIVNACSFLIATPREYQEQLRGGTWYTIHFARRSARARCIVLPNGTPVWPADEAAWREAYR